MPAFCFHFLTLMDSTCSTIISTATHLERLNTVPNKMTDIRKGLLLIMLEANKIQLLWSLTDHTHKVLHVPQALTNGSTGVLSSKGIYPAGNGEMFMWLTSAQHDQLWEESELLGKCLHSLQTRVIKLYYQKVKPIIGREEIFQLFHLSSLDDDDNGTTSFLGHFVLWHYSKENTVCCTYRLNLSLSAL